MRLKILGNILVNIAFRTLHYSCKNDTKLFRSARLCLAQVASWFEGRVLRVFGNLTDDVPIMSPEMQLSNLPSMLERKDIQQKMFRVTLAEMAEDVAIATL